MPAKKPPKLTWRMQDVLKAVFDESQVLRQERSAYSLNSAAKGERRQKGRRISKKTVDALLQRGLLREKRTFVETDKNKRTVSVTEFSLTPEGTTWARKATRRAEIEKEKEREAAEKLQKKRKKADGRPRWKVTARKVHYCTRNHSHVIRPGTEYALLTLQAPTIFVKRPFCMECAKAVFSDQRLRMYFSKRQYDPRQVLRRLQELARPQPEGDTEEIYDRTTGEVFFAEVTERAFEFGYLPTGTILHNGEIREVRWCHAILRDGEPLSNVWVLLPKYT